MPKQAAHDLLKSSTISTVSYWYIFGKVSWSTSKYRASGVAKDGRAQAQKKLAVPYQLI